MTENNLKRKYTKEFKDSILKRLDQPWNESVSDLSKELNISKSTIYKWMDDVNKDPDSWYFQDIFIQSGVIDFQKRNWLIEK